MTHRPTVKIHLIARLESKRVRRKNLRLLLGRPLLSYAIEAAKGVPGVDGVYLNTESPLLAELARDHGIDVFEREAWLAADDIVLDQTTYAFAKAHAADVIGMVNPVCPLTTSDDIARGLAAFIEGGYDSLVTVRNEQLHSFVGATAINFDPAGRIPMTQHLPPVEIVSWNFCFWRRDAFIAHYEAHGYAVFSGKLGRFALDKRTAVKISEEADFRIAEALLLARDAGAGRGEARFWPGDTDD